MDILRELKKRKKYFIIILILLVIYYLFFIRKVTCEDKECFEQKLSKCAGAKFYFSETSGGLTLYRINNNPLGFRTCTITAKMIKTGEISAQYKSLFERASMKCRIPRKNLIDASIASISQNIDYCHGPLKEAIYKVMIDSLYKLMGRDMNYVIEQVNTQMGIA